MQEILGFTAIPQMFPVLETFVDTILSSTGNICGMQEIKHLWNQTFA